MPTIQARTRPFYNVHAAAKNRHLCDLGHSADARVSLRCTYRSVAYWSCARAVDVGGVDQARRIIAAVKQEVSLRRDGGRNCNVGSRA